MRDNFVRLPSGCKAFGSRSEPSALGNWLSDWRLGLKNCKFILILAGSRTSEVEGISAAGATPESRRYTAIADAELLIKGPLFSRKWPLPPLVAGVSPALISFVASRFIGLKPLIIPLGIQQSPSFPFISVEPSSLGPSNCLSTGKAMDFLRVQKLWKCGFSMGLESREPLLIAECVPGGTTTAQAILTGLGIPVKGLVSSSLINPPVLIKEELVAKGLRSAGIGAYASSKKLVAAVGDPFQPLAAGLLLGAREAGQPVLMGGGSQMLAVLSLALESLPLKKRASFVEGVAIGTTAWLAEENKTSCNGSGQFERLIENIEKFFEVDILGISCGLRFHNSSEDALKDYELGYVKEGVGAGALAFLAQLNGVTCQQIIEGCEAALKELDRRIVR